MKDTRTYKRELRASLIKNKNFHNEDNQGMLLGVCDTCAGSSTPYDDNGDEGRTSCCAIL